MKQSPSWQADRISSSQIPHILCNPKDLCRTHKCPSPVSIMHQINPLYATTSKFLNIQLNNILSSMPRPPKWPLSIRFPHQNPVYAFPHTCYMPLLSHSSRFDQKKSEEGSSLSPSLCSFLHSPVTSSLQAQNILLNTLFSNTLSLRSFLNVSDQSVNRIQVVVFRIVYFCFV